jgi:hypothetical protein
LKVNRQRSDLTVESLPERFYAVSSSGSAGALPLSPSGAHRTVVEPSRLYYSAGSKSSNLKSSFALVDSSCWSQTVKFLLSCS